jgi:hypothetical protein
MRFLRHNGISMFFGVLMLASLVGQSFASLHHFNTEAVEHQSETYSWFRYVTSSEFGGDVMENWQSEFLQFFLYVFATVWLIERGSSESKKPENAGLMSDQSQLSAAMRGRTRPDGLASTGSSRSSTRTPSDWRC